MDEELYKYIVKTPEDYSGEVMGKLTFLEVTVEDVDVSNGIWIIAAKSRDNIVNNFEHWLLDLTKGAGTIETESSGERGHI